MLIKALIENTSISNEYGFEHGLSIYIETTAHKILFDLGKSDLFIDNALKLDVDLAQVDTVIVSHGHYDHGGGLKAFLESNKKAKIYIHDKAFEKHYSNRENDAVAYIGLDENLKSNEQIIFTAGQYKIDQELELFSDVSGNELLPVSNKSLLMEAGDGLIPDTFDHEQSLIISDNGTTVLIAGCAHRGIVSIVEHAQALKKRAIDLVIAGFHLYSPNANTVQDSELIKKIAERLMKTGSKYYTCHCTGTQAFGILEAIMNERMQYLSTGSVINI